MTKASRHRLLGDHHEDVFERRFFFAGLTEHTFTTRLGVADPPLVDCLAEMLVHFVRTDAIYGIRIPTGERLSQAVGRARRRSRCAVAARVRKGSTLFCCL